MTIITIKEWTIIQNNSLYMVIGIDEYDRKIKLYECTNSCKVNNYNITLLKKNTEIKLYFDNYFKPTYIDKELYDWSIHDYKDEELIDIKP